MSDFLIEEDIRRVDPTAARIIESEEARQKDKIILIASESIAPKAVREALGSVFTNIYAEGHPSLKMTRDTEERLTDFSHQLAYYRRYADRRYYKGKDYVNLIEALAMRRAADCFATKEIASDEIYVNVQPLSGAAANNSVYHAFTKPGDTVMGMALTHGGHLTHGSPYHRSGKEYRIVPYEVDPKDGKLNYEKIKELAVQHKPRMIIAGYSSYPWQIDWKKFREIADSVPGGAILFADIAHTAGLVAAGVMMSPVGYADVITFTTHKTLCGPRGAVIITTDEEKASLIDEAVFPGEQGGPHVNKFAAMAVTFKIAQNAQFKKLQKKILENARLLAGALKKRGLKLAYGGTDTHLLVVDLKAIKTNTGVSLSGEIASRLLELAGVVVNRNTLPGDEISYLASGIRLGTTWVTQEGMGKKEMEKLADIISQVVVNIRPFNYIGAGGILPRGKIDKDILRDAKEKSEKLIADTLKRKADLRRVRLDGCNILKIRGERAKAFLQSTLAGDILPLKKDEILNTALFNRKGKIIGKVSVLFQGFDKKREFHYLLRTSPDKREEVSEWLEGLSDGYILFDDEDLFAKIEGPVVIEKADSRDAELFKRKRGRTDEGDIRKPYFIGERTLREKTKTSKKKFQFKEEKTPEARRTPLYEEHLKAGAKLVPFAGWEMPVWYSRTSIEHKTVREAAGLFDVGHMGIIEIAGRDAATFIDVVACNYVHWLKPGESQYSFILDPEGKVLDDVIVYCRSEERYMMVVNAANAPKIWQWLKGVHSGELLIDNDFSEKEIRGDVKLRDLRDSSAGAEQRMDLALQGPASLAILQHLASNQALSGKLSRLRKNEFIEAKLGGTKMIISRTGYTGEDVGYELYLHPSDAVKIWKLLLEKGKDLGIVPAGLGARDSTRTEAGFPLYGHELAGAEQINPLAAAFGVFVKLHKPFFVGKRQVMSEEAKRKKEIIRFQMKDKGIMTVRTGYKIEDNGGRDLGVVTSSVLVEGHQIGMAYIERDYISEGGEIKILIPSREEKYAAVILPRFPIAEKSDES